MARRSLASIVIVAVLAAIALTGCGFQTRGDLNLSGTIRVEGGSFVLRDALETGLAGRGAMLAGKDADIVLAIRSPAFGERVLSVGPKRGDEREYQIAFHVRYTIRTRDGESLADPGAVTVVREYRVHPGQRRSRALEREIVHDEMRREAAATILRRLHAALPG